MTFQNKPIDCEQKDIKFLGFFGILNESLEIIISCPKIFIQIILAFILPQSCIFLYQSIVISQNNNNISLSTLDIYKQVVSPTYNNTSYSIFSVWGIFWGLISMILSLNSISAITYTVACIYTREEITFRKAISVFSKVWKRLIITFLSRYCIILAYTFVVLLVILPIMFFYNSGNVPKIGISLVVLIIAILYLVGMLYMFLTWQLSDVVSVMEKNCGFKALKKSKELIKGKMGIAFAMLVLNLLLGIPTLILIQKLAGFGIVARILFGILSLVLWSLFNLFVLVVQTVFYLVCKSNNYESIKDLSLDNDLGEYVTLDTEVTNLEQSLV